jgi:type I restriction enzyme R subunit
MVIEVLSNEAVAKGFAELMFDVWMKGLGNTDTTVNK